VNNTSRPPGLVALSDVEPNPPIVDAYRDPEGGLHLICPGCSRWHHHASTADVKVGEIVGHRTGHCGWKVPGEVMLKAGYTLRLAGVYTDAMRQDAQERERAYWAAHWNSYFRVGKKR
jgi:hypothetical protein